MTEDNAMQENNIQGPQNLPPYKIAFVIDGEVADILHTDERLFAIFMSNPKLIDVTEQVTANPQSIQIGYLYNMESNTFSVPEESDNV
jgi:hypothetical protein